MPSAKTFSRAVLMAAWPIVAGYVVLGIPCGILAASAGLNIWQVALMSLLLYSGVGQYMIPNMWIAGAPVASIILSVSLLNSRQVLYGASLSRFMGTASRRLSFLFSALVTDETFGVNLAHFTHDSTWSLRQATGVNLCSQCSWTLANILGVLAGSLLSVPVALASFAMTSIFICLLFTQHFTWARVMAAVTSAIVVIICKLLGLSGPAIILGALIGIVLGLVVQAVGKRGEGSRRGEGIGS
ncbi:MAG: AzlC family ABC transporter permease [Coriobacteriales bacterium]|jgi:4-azaleucine resistance transporter AzlC|nr:AzlC family ABC transporter permease [Coriobacteriales bacterium]